MRFARKAGIETAPMPGQTVLFDPDKKTFCVLNETAAFLWETLSQEATSDELSSALARSFEVPDDDTARRDVRAALDELRRLDLITAVS
jgi:PqqD family protein of HPr-rel-A system